MEFLPPCFSVVDHHCRPRWRRRRWCWENEMQVGFPVMGIADAQSFLVGLMILLSPFSQNQYFSAEDEARTRQFRIWPSPLNFYL